MKTITAERVNRDGGSRISLRFAYDQELIEVVKELPDARWSSSGSYWHISDSLEIISLLLNSFQGKAYVDYSALNLNLAEKIRLTKEEKGKKAIGRVKISSYAEFPILSKKGEEDIARYRRWMEANRYPEATIQNYSSMMVKFLRFMSPKEASECTSDDLIRIVEEYILPNGLSYSFQNQMISSVKKFYGNIYKTVIDPGEVNRPRTRHRLPNVLSKEDIKRILSVITNEKHRVMLSLIYACGLRRSELLQLLPADVETGRKLLRIREAKGFKDRVVPVSKKIIEMIDDYLKHYKPKFYLFEGHCPGKDTVQVVWKKY